MILTDQRLGTEPIRRLFVSMTVPVVLQQLLMLLNNVVDRIWIAHIPDVGQLAFTASGVCVPIIYMIIALSELTGTGILSRVGLLLGQGHHDQAERTLGSMMAFSILLAMLTLLLVEVFCPELIRIFGGSPQTAAMAECYLRISTPGNAACIISSMLAPFLLVPFVWLLPRLLTDHADMGVFLAQPVTDVVVGAVTVIVLSKSLQNYKNIQNNKV